MTHSIWESATLSDLAATAQRLGRSQVTSMHARLKLQARVVKLEEELAWTSRVASALAAICIEKGLVTPEELESRLAALDAAEKAAAAADAKAADAEAARKRSVRSGRRRKL